jgi:hypothetical protein
MKLIPFVIIDSLSYLARFFITIGFSENAYKRELGKKLPYGYRIERKNYAYKLFPDRRR